jgi:hypothetical protein
MTQPRIRRAITTAGVAFGLVALAYDISRGGPAFWPLVFVLTLQVTMGVSVELADRRGPW